MNESSGKDMFSTAEWEFLQLMWSLLTNNNDNNKQRETYCRKLSELPTKI
jgi:hypothetical protein